MVSGWWGKGAPSTIKSVYPKNINQVGISLRYTDRYILEWIRLVTGYTGPIRDYTATGGYPQAELRISGVPEWIRDLQHHWNLVPNKSRVLAPPSAKLTTDQIAAFLVGFIEGDGHIGDANGTLKVSVVTASKELADWLEAQFARISGGMPSRELHIHGVAHYVLVYGYNARRLCEQLLRVGVHKLTRKWAFAESEIRRMRHQDLLKTQSARNND